MLEYKVQKSLRADFIKRGLREFAMLKRNVPTNPPMMFSISLLARASKAHKYLAFC